MKQVCITSLARTAVGRFGGSLKDVGAIDLGAHVVKAAMERSKLTGDQIDRIVLGENIQINRGGNPARRVGIAADLPVEIDAYTINMNCASGLRAIVAGTQDIMMDEVGIVVAGGMENMSQTPYLVEKARFGYKLGNGELVDFLADHILGDAGPMAENVAEKYGISRERQDEFALASQTRMAAAMEKGLFKEEIVPTEVRVKRDTVVFDVDEYPRPDTTLEKMAKLRPVFKAGGTVTAANASGINDGGAAVALMTDERAHELGLAPLAFVRDWASAGVEPNLFGIGPVPAVRKLLKKTGLSLDDIALIELNEAFASSSVAVIDELGLDSDKVNVNGGAIAMGHPVGATGVILTIKLVQELRRRQQRYGIVTMCIGSGQGMAVLIENPAHDGGGAGA